MFKSKRKFEGDIGCEWAKDDTLDKRFEELPEYCDFIAVRHWLLKCGSTPCFEMFFEKEFLKTYLDSKVAAGDALEIWHVYDEKLLYIHAKMPDDNGLIPVKGCAY